MEEMNEIGARRKLSMRSGKHSLSRQGIFATQFIKIDDDNDGKAETYFSKAPPPGRSRGSFEMRESSLVLQEDVVLITCILYDLT
jgi:hypothetical protein